MEMAAIWHRSNRHFGQNLLTGNFSFMRSHGHGSQRPGLKLISQLEGEIKILFHEDNCHVNLAF